MYRVDTILFFFVSEHKFVLNLKKKVYKNAKFTYLYYIYCTTITKKKKKTVMLIPDNINICYLIIDNHLSMN